MTILDKANLTNKILQAGVPIDGIGRNPDGSLRVDFQVIATDQQKATALTIVASYDQAAEDAAKATADAAKATAINRVKQAKAAVDDITAKRAILANSKTIGNAVDLLLALADAEVDVINYLLKTL